MRSPLLTLIIVLLSTIVLSAQNYFTLTGKVVAQENGKPLSYAHVGIPEKGIGTTTGFDGSFVLKVPEQYAKSTLLASFVGYSTFREPIQSLRSPITIRLKVSPANLQEIIVMDERTIEDIIRRAVRQIPDNYPDHPTTVLGFYRESRTNKEQDYIYLAEGVLHIHKKSYEKDDEGQTGLVQGRAIILKPEEVAKHSGFYSGHLAGHRFDIVKNREDFIDENYFPDYKYWIQRVTSYQDRPVFVIGFDKAEGSKGRMKGSIYIDTLSYAFLRAEFEILPEGLRKTSDYPLYAGNWKANRYITNYRKLGDKWFFSDALREGVYRDGGVYSNEIKITEIDAGRGKPVPYAERLDRSDEFLEITGEYDEDFWKQYNTTPLNEGLAQSVQQLKNQEKAAEVFDSTYLAELKRQRDSLRQVQSQTETESESRQPDLGIRINPPGQRGNDGFRPQFMANFGLGAHFLYTEAANMGIAFLESPDGQAILSTTDDMPARSLEPLATIDLSFFFNEHFFLRGGWTRNFTNAIYRERALGAGAQLNLSKGRPFFLRGSVQHSHFKYARLVGQADNEYGKFKADKKRFKSEKINMYYGSRTHNVKLSLEMALELTPSMEIFARGGYLLPFARQQHLYLWERERFFKKKERLQLDNFIQVERNGESFDGRIMDEQSLYFTVGIVVK